MILKSELGNDKAFMKSPPSERKSKLRVWEPSEFMVRRKRGWKELRGKGKGRKDSAQREERQAREWEDSSKKL